MQLIRSLVFSLLFLPAVCPANNLLTSLGSDSQSQLADTRPYSGSEEQALESYQAGLNYLLGRNGVARSSEKAARIFRSLAERNWSSAQHMLGNMYMSGKGVEQNDLLAYKWLSLASKNNIRLAESIQSKRKELYRRLQDSLSSEALDKVDSWIADWQPERASIR